MIIDIKTGGAERWHELQTAAYDALDEWDTEFDPAAHRYSIDGVILPSVTQVISRFVDMKGDHAAMARGTAVHVACELLLRNELDWSTVDSRIIGYVASFGEWLSVTGFVVRDTELRGRNSIHGYAGTLDLRGDLPGGLRALRRGALYLQADGSVGKIKAHTNGTDFAVFVGMLNFYRWENAK